MLCVTPSTLTYGRMFEAKLSTLTVRQQMNPIFSRDRFAVQNLDLVCFMLITIKLICQDLTPSPLHQQIFKIRPIIGVSDVLDRNSFDPHHEPLTCTSSRSRATNMATSTTSIEIYQLLAQSGQY